MEIINNIVWSIATILLISVGIYFTIKLRGIQFNVPKMISSFHSKKKTKITPFASLMMATSARIGVGSLAGIALALLYGGPGTIFWLWTTTLIVASNSFAESTLGVRYQEKDGNYYKGGPAYYIGKGLKNKKLGQIYAFLIIITYIVAFMTIQANTITISITSKFPIAPIIIAIIIATLAFLAIYKGLKSIVSFTNNIVPIMGLGYILLGLVVVFINIEKLPSIFNEIITSAFDLKAFSSGLLTTILIGIQRGIFSNEAGIGSGAIASGSVDNEKPASQGMIQVVGVYFTSLIVCTITALIVLSIDYSIFTSSNYNGIEIIQYALDSNLGNIGELSLILIITLFAFSTIITGYYYGESNLKYLYPKIKKQHLYILKSVVAILLLWGSLAQSNVLWSIVDILVAILAIVNIYAIFSLRKEVVKEKQRL